jgi:hypothetical protein
MVQPSTFLLMQAICPLHLQAMSFRLGLNLLLTLGPLLLASAHSRVGLAQTNSITRH